MNRIQVSASRNYDVLIGTGLINNCAEHILPIHHPKKVAVISDSNVAPLYAAAVENSLTNANIEVHQFIFPAGEASKTLSTFGQILNFLAENQLTRSDLLIALGGGVVGDIAGFCAACYLRGIPFVQIPTSLLAMVDSSVGGKTAVDLPAGKNLAGAFYQPSLVLCDVDTLSTLPDETFLEGCAEIIKYGVLFDADLFCDLSRNATAFDRVSVITRCVELKRDIVAKDEFDKGERQLLNLGHTVGHAVELLSNMTISHGNAVAIGMSVVARSCAEKNLCSLQDAEQIVNTISRFGLPTETSFTAREIADAMLNDKKRFGNTVNLIVPRTIGRCEIHTTQVDQLENFIKAGL